MQSPQGKLVQTGNAHELGGKIAFILAQPLAQTAQSSGLHEEKTSQTRQISSPVKGHLIVSEGAQNLRPVRSPLMRSRYISTSTTLAVPAERITAASLENSRRSFCYKPVGGKWNSNRFYIPQGRARCVLDAYFGAGNVSLGEGTFVRFARFIQRAHSVVIPRTAGWTLKRILLG